MIHKFSGIPANVAALLPFPSDPSSHTSSPHTVPSAAVASPASITAPPPLAINHEQLAALAKFASNGNGNGNGNSSSQTTSGEHEFPPFLPPRPVTSGIITSQPYIPPPKPKPISPPAAPYPASSRNDRGPGERDSHRHIDKERRGGRREDSRLFAQSMSSFSSTDKHRQDDNWRAGRQGEKRSRSRSPDRLTNGHGHRLNMPQRRPAASLPNPPTTTTTTTTAAAAARLSQAARGNIVEGDGEEDMALDISDGEERAKRATVAQAAYHPPNVAPPYLSVPPVVVAPPFPPPSNAPPQQQQQQQQQTPMTMSMSSVQPMNRRNDLITLHTFPLQTFDPSSADSWAKLGEAWQNSTGREPEQMELMHWLATGQVIDFKMMRMGMGTGTGMDMGQENGDCSSHLSQGDMNGLSSVTANPASGLLPPLPPPQMRMGVGTGSAGQPTHLSMGGGGDQWSNVQGQAQWSNDDVWSQRGAQGQGY